MAFETPTWNQNVPASAGESPSPYFGHVDYGGTAAMGQALAIVGERAAKSGMRLLDAQERQEDEMAKMLGLAQKVEYDKAIHAASASFRETVRLDSVKGQPQFETYFTSLRENMAGVLDEKARQHFLVRSADSMLSADAMAKTHAADQLRAWQDDQLKAEKSNLLVALAGASDLAASVPSQDQKAKALGAIWSTLGRLGDYGLEAAGFQGATQPEQLHLARNVAVAEGVATVIQTLISKKDGPLLDAFLKDVKENKEGGKEVVDTLRAIHPGFVEKADEFVYKSRVTSNALELASTSRLVGTMPIRTDEAGTLIAGKAEKLVYPSTVFDYARAKSKLDSQLKQGQISGVEYRDTLDALNAQATASQHAWQSEITTRVNDFTRDYENRRFTGAQPSVAWKDASATSFDAAQWLITFAPKVWRTMEFGMSQDRHAAMSSRTPEQRLAYFRVINQFREPGSLASMNDTAFKAIIENSNLHDMDKQAILTRLNAEVSAIRKGKPPPSSVDRAVYMVALEHDRSSYDGPPDKRNATAQARLMDVTDMVRDWYQSETIKNQGVTPSDAEVRSQAQVYWWKVKEAEGPDYWIYQRGPKVGIAEELVAGRKPREPLFQLTEKQQQEKAEWIRLAKERIKRQPSMMRQYQLERRKGEKNAEAWLNSTAEQLFRETVTTRPPRFEPLNPDLVGAQPTYDSERGGFTVPGYPVAPDPMDSVIDSVYPEESE
jgi:hypothetical protein